MDVVEELHRINQAEQWEQERDSDISSNPAQYCKCTYNYGITELDTWAKAFRTSTVQKALQLCREEIREYSVLGSSIGWLVFYGTLSYPELNCVGIDLLQSQIHISNRVKEQFHVDRARFRCMDALDYLEEGSQLGIVMVCSLCWPDRIRVQVFQKLLEILDEHAVVITYHEAQVKHVKYWCQKTKTPWAFRLVERVEDAKFSWDPSGADFLYIWKKTLDSSIVNIGDVDSQCIKIIANQRSLYEEACRDDAAHEVMCSLFN